MILPHVLLSAAADRYVLYGFHSYMLGERCKTFITHQIVQQKLLVTLLGRLCNNKVRRRRKAMLSTAASSSNELTNFIVIYDTISATPCTSDTYCYPDTLAPAAAAAAPPPPPLPTKVARRGGSDVGGCGGRSKKRRRKARVCKNKEEAESQRMTHIAVERNRRKLMNEHLALLRSLMPPSYVQRGDQASIVAGAIEFVKELEHSLHSLQAKKLQHPSPPFAEFFNHTSTTSTQDTTNNNGKPTTNSFNNTKTILTTTSSSSPPSSSSSNDEDSSDASDGIAGIEVTLIETHANLRFLTRKRSTNRRPWQLSKLVEEGCQLSSVDDIAAAVHHMLRLIIEQEEDSGIRMVEYPGQDFKLGEI
ncbi:Transcription factor bHLH71 [Linum grandiflorum]